MLEKGFMTFKNNKISIEEEHFEQNKNTNIRMNPLNIHAGKLKSYNLILVDGYALRSNTIE